MAEEEEDDVVVDDFPAPFNATEEPVVEAVDYGDHILRHRWRHPVGYAFRQISFVPGLPVVQLTQIMVVFRPEHFVDEHPILMVFPILDSVSGLFWIESLLV